MSAASSGPLPPGPSHRVLEQAAEWFALLLSGEATAADRRRWEAWLSASDEHRQAWAYVEKLSQRLDPIKASAQPWLAASAYRQAGTNRGRRRQVLLGLAAFAGTGMLAWAGWRHTPLAEVAAAWAADYRSGTGEIREIALADGTRVWLNAASAFDQDYQPGHRLLRLLRGEMLVDTASDPLQRPFHVDTGQGRLRALGTRFNVRLDEGAQTSLAVYEGAVEVQPLAGPPSIVRAGQQLRFTAAGASGSGPADPAREAWTRGVLIARDIPLAEFVAELRRHHHGHLGLAPELAGLRVFGSYPADDPPEALAMLEAVMPIEVRRPLPWWISIEPRRPAAGR
ncbi:FecR family protein [Thauera sp. SDU_THAU2]|uniref:FecR family protein n=1 Tax=Thauera sp. SDU_THAU2 TaxID=3136633 RepID=UPI00311FD0A5